jgi:hypothetical protein
MNYHYSHRKTSTSIRGGAKLVACAVLIAGAFAAKLLFPEFADFARSQISAANSDTSVNYKAAFSAMGEVLAGGAKPEAVLTALIGKDEPAVFVNYEYTPGSGSAAFERLGEDRKIFGGAGDIEIETVNVNPQSTASEASPVEEAVLTFDYAVETSPDGRVYAYDDGSVIADGDSALYGKYLIIYHGDLTAEYYHCAALNVKSGDTVVKGQQIATSK